MNLGFNFLVSNTEIVIESPSLATRLEVKICSV